MTVVVTGAAGPLGRRVVSRVAADPAVDRVVVVDRTGADLPRGPALTPVPLDLTDPELQRACEGATAVIHLGTTAAADAEPALDGTGTSDDGVAGTRALLEVLGGSSVTTLVVLSSAMVYGAWSNNPVPLTEEAPIRPDPELPFASRKAEIERLVGEWGEDQAGTGGARVSVAVLRPTISVGPESAAWLSRSPWTPTGVQIDDAEPASQFLHLDDLAAAIDLARTARLDGTFNVAPDGWIPAEQLRALRGPAPRVHLPNAVAERIAALRFRFGLTGIPPSVLPYTRYSWVVANDRLRAAGWEPGNSNEEAFVAADSGGPLASLNPRRRQLLAFGAVGVGVAAVVTTVVVLIRRGRVARLARRP